MTSQPTGHGRRNSISTFWRAFPLEGKLALLFMLAQAAGIAWAVHAGLV